MGWWKTDESGARLGHGPCNEVESSRKANREVEEKELSRPVLCTIKWICKVGIAHRRGLF